MKESDIKIKEIITRRIEFDSSIDSANITVEVAGGKVRLTGTVPTLTQKNDLTRLLWSVRWVHSIDNQLQTTFHPEAAVPADPIIQENVQTAIKINAYTQDEALQVSVADGVVTLSGVVDAHWKVIKLEKVVSEVAGVKDVSSVITVVPTDKISDEVIAKNIIEAFKENQYIEADKILVTVADGKVTLDGDVLSVKTVIEAYDCASRIRGVTGVINDISIK